MYNLTGEFEVKLDDKSRMRLPSSLIRQLGGTPSMRLVINRGFEKCLILYPIEAWEEKTNEVNQLNLYNPKDRTFARYFYRGATEIVLDSSDRLLIPKSLLEHADIQQEVFLLAYHNQIEIWSKKAYLAMIQEEPDDFSSLAAEVFRHKDVRS